MLTQIELHYMNAKIAEADALRKFLPRITAALERIASSTAYIEKVLKEDEDAIKEIGKETR